MKKLTLTAFTMLVLLACPVMAQDDDGAEHDILEIGLIGGLGIPSGGITEWTDGLNAETGYTIGLDIGYFFNSQLIGGFNFTYQQLNVDHFEAGSTSHRLYNPSLYLKYILPSESNWEFYGKGLVGVENPKFTTFVQNEDQNRYRAISYDPALSLGAAMGIFYFTSDYSGLFIEGSYHAAFTSDIEAEYIDVKYPFGEDLTTWNLNIGIRLLVGSDE